MRMVRVLFFWVAGVCIMNAATLEQSGHMLITGIRLDSGCYYINGSSGTMPPCPIGPGMILTIQGPNFGSAMGYISLCDCAGGGATIQSWTPTRVVARVDEVTPRFTVSLESPGGTYSNLIPYIALAPVITRIEVGNCIYTPNQTRHLCVINPGTQVTIVGNYFGQHGWQVATCDCAQGTIDSWDPDWLTHSSTHDNHAVVTVADAECGSSIEVEAGGMWSNPVPYTTCGN